MNKMILCTDSKYGIGKNGTIPWHSTEDFKHFKDETTDKKVLMGYNTWKSLSFRPLTDRLNIIVTSREISNDAFNKRNNVIFISKNSLNDFLTYNNDIIVIGGSTIYEASLPYIDEVILSQISGDYECDTFFDIHSYNDYSFVPTSCKELKDGVVVTYLTKKKFL